MKTLFPTNNALWLSQAACRGDHNPDAWFCAKSMFEARRAERVCRSCPVADLCEDAARARGEEFGRWGRFVPAQKLPADAA